MFFFLQSETILHFPRFKLSLFLSNHSYTLAKSFCTIQLVQVTKYKVNRDAKHFTISLLVSRSQRETLDLINDNSALICLNNLLLLKILPSSKILLNYITLFHQSPHYKVGKPFTRLRQRCTA